MFRVLIVATFVLASLARAAAQQTVFRAETDLVSFGVTVVDRRGNFVTDLARDDFEILEDGKPQTLKYFLAGNQAYHCTPWGNPTRTVFGWQRPCYLLGEGYAETFKALMEETDWDSYGVGNYEKCANCMVHSGFEASAVTDSVKHPLKALGVTLRGVRTDGPMAKDIPLDKQRPAEFVFSRHVERRLEAIRTQKAVSEERAEAD